MYFIYLMLSILLVMLNLAGMTALISRYLPAQASARVLGIVLLTLTLFCFEHFNGLGKLSWLWPVTSLLALWLIRQRLDRAFWVGECVFAAGFLYGLAWRFAFPNIDAGSEHLTDLYFISNYRAGDTLPGIDHWLAGQRFDCYYALQHYGAALMGRWFDLGIGLAMNIAWALLMGLMVSLAWEVTAYFIKPRAYRLLIVAALVLGGDGISPLVPYMFADHADCVPAEQNEVVKRIWAATRFNGMYDQQVNTDLGRFIAGDPSAVGFNEHLELPLETIAYYSVLGDYHPPLSGFVIALWTLALTAFISLRVKNIPMPITSMAHKRLHPETIAYVALGLTPALVLVSNAWVFPLQQLLVGSWLLHRHYLAEVKWPVLLVAGLLGFALIYPFLSYFAPNVISAPISWVPAGEHTPWRFGLAMHWPLILWLLAGGVLARRTPWVAGLVLCLTLILLGSELFFVDDPLGGKYQRFNTTLKWWSWLWPTALVGLGSAALGLGNRLIKAMVALSLAALLIYAVDLGRYWRYTEKPQFGRLAGDAWLKQNPNQRELITYLQNIPAGLVMESIPQDAYTQSTAFALFGHQAAVLGWPAHISQWRGQLDYVQQRLNSIRAFYRAELPEPLVFLRSLPVDYIIWTASDEQNLPGGQQKIDAQIADNYLWRRFSGLGSAPVGLWVRRPGK